MKHYFVFNNQSPERLTTAQAEFIDSFLNPINAKSKAKDLKLVSEIATFSSEIPLDRKEKDALHSVKMITDSFKKIGKK